MVFQKHKPFLFFFFFLNTINTLELLDPHTFFFLKHLLLYSRYDGKVMRKSNLYIENSSIVGFMPCLHLDVGLCLGKFDYDIFGINIWINSIFNYTNFYEQPQ